MVRVEKRVNKKIIISLILALVLVFLIFATVLLNYLAGKTGSSGTVSSAPPLEVLDGESTYGKYNLAYPQISDSAILTIKVSDGTDSFALSRPDKNGDMELWYINVDGKLERYFPNILDYSESADYNYSSLYAIDSTDTLGIGMGVIPYVSYLCSAVGTTAFQARIELSDDVEKRAAQLESFGLSANQSVDVTVTFASEIVGDKIVKEDEYTLKIGKQTVAGAGRYFMVDDRNYIYCSSFDYFDYGLQGFTYFIKPYVVTEGLSGNQGVLAAYLTQDFSQWKNTKHDNLGDVVASGSQVIVDAQIMLPDDPWNPSKEVDADGYLYDSFTKYSFDLSSIKDDPEYSRVVAALTGKTVGTYFNYKESTDESDAIIFTLTSQSKTISFGDKESLTYEYEIHYIESILTDTAEISDAGTPIGAHKLLKVGYSFKVDGVQVGKNCHAVIDLNDERIPDSVRATLSAARVGDLDKTVKFTVDYTKDTARKYEVKYVICDILGIYDKKGKTIEKVTNDSTVRYRYYLEVNGKRYDEILSSTISLADPEEGVTEDESTIKLREILREKLKGKSVSYDIEIPVMTYTEYNETLYDFVTYKIAEICYFVTSELVTSFGYVNASDRDPFFGETYYANKMPGKNSLYGINADSCLGVIKYFMGISGDSSSSSSSSSSAVGLYGGKTVAIGLTPENMDKYGLYAYTIHIELPRSVYVRNDANSEDENEIDNYGCETTLSFYLYISEEQIDGTRYIASDMYDLVAVIDGDMFEFLEYDFAEFWARRHLLLVDYLEIENMKFSFNMDELKGNYSINIKHGELYLNNGRPTTSTDEDGRYYAISDITVSQSGDCKETVLSTYLAENGLDSILLSDLYDNIMGDGSKVLMGERDYLGSANYREFMYLLYGIYYTDYISDLTEEQKNEIKESAPLMSMSVELYSMARPYVYEFHRIDDRRVMVTLYRADADGNQMGEEVSDFYISTAAFKKVVGAFFDVINVKTVDTEAGYPSID